MEAVVYCVHHVAKHHHEDQGEIQGKTYENTLVYVFPKCYSLKSKN